MLQAQTTFTVVNNYNNNNASYTDYFGNYYTDDQVWLYFLNAGTGVTYTGTSGTQTVTDAVAVQLSAVQNGTFQLATGLNSTKVFAGFGATNPFVGSNGPGLFDQNVPYALAEWTLMGNNFDNMDISYIDSVSFPTKLTVTGSSPSTTTFPVGTTASSIITTLKTKTGMTGPVGPASNMPSSGQVGFGPEVGTVSGQPNSVRWIGSSKYWISAPGSTPETATDRGMYTYAPTLNDYLGFLQANAPTTNVNGTDITGWYIDYSGNGGYSGFLTVTGTNGAYGLEIGNVRVNTNPSAANDWEADPTAGTAITGEIIVLPNGETIVYDFGDGDNNVTGNWTDAVIYSGADVLGTGDFVSGPIISATGDLATGTYDEYVPTMLASISASLGTGLLGSDMYMTKWNDTGAPGSTMYWFATITKEQVLLNLFDNGSWGGNSDLDYYDLFWGTMAELSEMQGYLSPFSDRYANLSPDVGFFVGDSATWELGILPIPEPGTAGLVLATLGGAFFLRRTRKTAA